MPAMAPMQQYARAMSENRMRDRMAQETGMTPGAGAMDAIMAEMMAGKTVAGKGRKRKAKK